MRPGMGTKLVAQMIRFTWEKKITAERIPSCAEPE